MIELSIIIPVYNGEKVISRCIDSILNQSFKAYEIIVVDDGSKDNTAEIVKAYRKANDNVRLLQKSNGGAGSARNTGIKNARGEFIMFIDADDIIQGENYLLDFFENRSFDYIAGGLTHKYLDDNGKITKETTQALADCENNNLKSLPDTFFVNGFVHTSCSKLYKLSLVKEFNIAFPDFRLSEDTAFNLSYLKHIKNWKIINNSGYCYLHEKKAENATSKFVPGDILIYVNIFEKAAALNIDEQIIKKMMFYQFYALCYKCVMNTDYSNNQKKETLNYFMKQPYVKNVLRTAKTSWNDRISGQLFTTRRISWIKAWFSIVNKSSVK